VGDPPVIVGHNENIELETQMAEVKAELKARKEEARVMIEEMEQMGRDLASRECQRLLHLNLLTETSDLIRIQECRASNNSALHTARLN
jgi:hypothetical protein